MDAQAVSILRGLVNVPWIEVAFLINSDGHVLLSVGSSPAFSHNGEIVPSTSPLDGEPETSVYVTAVATSVYLGVLFEADAAIEDVRAEVSRVEEPLSLAIAG